MPHLLEDKQHAVVRADARRAAEPVAVNPSYGAVLQLQREVGNRAVTLLLAGPRPSVQRAGPQVEVTAAANNLKALPSDLETDRTKRTAEFADRNWLRRKFGWMDEASSDTQRFGLAHKADLEAVALDPHPDRSAEILAKKFPTGPDLTTPQFQLIDSFSRRDPRDPVDPDGGRKWLSEAGLFPIDQAVKYLTDHNYHSWLLLDAANRVLLGHLAWHGKDTFGPKVVEGTPAFRLGRSMEIGSRPVDDERRQEHLADVDREIQNEWLKTLAPMSKEEIRSARHGIAQGGARDEHGDSMSESGVATRYATGKAVLEKILLILQSGLQTYDKSREVHVDYQGAVARALSHGGRVTVRVPQIAEGQNANQLMEWLGVVDQEGDTNEARGYFKRGFGTHHINIGKNQDGAAGTGTFREEGGKGAAAATKLEWNARIYGLNLAIGGLGKRDFNNDVILPDGAHGHLLLVWQPPRTDRDGALEIGIETTGPHAPSTVGYAHTADSSEATANPESSFGGMKAHKIGDGSPDELKWYGAHAKEGQGERPDAATNARLVDMTKAGDRWLENLKALEEQFAKLKKANAHANELLVGDRGSFSATMNL